ncbi:hypothetical protein SCHPADRAFT_1002694 [Schizopora paradoxa]|uniref:Uncharacterized protein n=1 Tax=Schizopora paradoxa TaxID=27342 RepID=A0A0H2R372_9AGAM|nr:hypothetical protein SCHPADRAFT_1002694 [Schizopora paradoxa]
MAQILRNIKAKLKGGQRQPKSMVHRLHGGAVASGLPLGIDTVSTTEDESALTSANSQTFAPGAVESRTVGREPIVAIHRPVNDRSPHEIVWSSAHERPRATSIRGVGELYRRESSGAGLPTAMIMAFSASQTHSETRSRFLSQPHMQIYHDQD